MEILDCCYQVKVQIIAHLFLPGCKEETYFESCGIADLVATCHGGRNRLLGESVVSSDKVSVMAISRSVLISLKV